MLDMKFVKEHLDEVQQNIENRFMKVDAAKAVELYDRRVELIHQVEALRQQRNENAKSMKAKMSDEERTRLIQEGKALKHRIAELEVQLSETESSLSEIARTIPNMSHPDAPVGKEEKDNLEIKRCGAIPQFDFSTKDHVELGTQLDIIDFETAARVTGPKFYYLRNEGVFLELGLVRYALDKLTSHGFTPTITPDIAREEVVEGIGFNPRGEESNIYTLEGTGTCLVGTAEITLGGYHSGDLFDAENLPVKLAGLSHCFRREAGAAGQFSRGLYRVHQFTKVEMFVYCLPEESEQFHQQMLAIEEEIFGELGIPYRVVDTCTGDLGAPAWRKFDLEAWMPGRGETGDWGEVTSTSNCTDYQSRRLGVRYRSDQGNRHVHMLNGTAIAVSRALVAILENFQQEDGSVQIPKALVPYTGFASISAKQ